MDVTFGGGGHSREILKRMDSDGELYGFDQDADAEHNIPDDSRFVFVRSNFRYLYNFMRYHGVDGEVDGLLADLGVSSHHFDDKDRGFSFRFDGALDMRMNTRAGQTAADIVNNYTEEALADIFYLYGELKVARRLASLIVRTRENKKIETIGDFLELVKPFTGKRQREKVPGTGIPGPSYRSERRNVCPERNAATNPPGLKARRTFGCNHLPFSGRQAGKELPENRKF